MLTATYFILVRDQPYHELTGKHFDRRDTFRITQRPVKRLQTLGYQVQLKAA